MAHDVFLSYSSKDKTVADAACAMLEAKGVRCWMAPRDIMPGAEWGAAIIEAIGAARIMVLIYTASSNASPQVRREVERAVARGLHVIPFRVEDVPMSPALEYFISTPHWLDAISPPLERHLDHLARIVKAVMEAHRTGVPGGGAGVDPLDPGPAQGSATGAGGAGETSGWTHGPPPGAFAQGAVPAATAAAPIPKPHGAGEVPRFTAKRSNTPLLVGGGVLALLLVAVVIIFATSRGGAGAQKNEVAANTPAAENTAANAGPPAQPATLPSDGPARQPAEEPAKEVVEDVPVRPPVQPAKPQLTAQDVKRFWDSVAQGDTRQIAVEDLVADFPGLVEQKNPAGNTPLYEAAAGGHVQLVTLLLDRKANPKALSSNGNTPLHGAAAAGVTNRDLVRALARGNLDAKNAAGGTPLHVAAAAGHAATVRLLAEAGADPNLADKNGRTPLQLAQRMADAAQAHDAAAALVVAGARSDVADRRGDTPLHVAARAGDAKLVSLMLEKGARPNVGDAAGRTPLHLAVGAAKGPTKSEVIAALTSRKAAVEVADAEGNTPLHLAAAAGDAAAAEALLKAGAKVATSTKERQTALHVAAAAGHAAMVELLMRNGGAEVLTGGKPPTPAEVAARAGKAEVAALLRRLEFPAMLQAAIRAPGRPVPPRLLEMIRKDPSLVGPGPGGRNALHDAAAAGNAAFAAELVKVNPALVKQLTAAEETPLHVAAANGHAPVAKVLLGAGASVLATTSAGDTPLHSAARTGRSEVIRVLLDAGADPSSTNRGRETPAEVARDATVRGELETAEQAAGPLRDAWAGLALAGQRYEMTAPGLSQPLTVHFVDRANCVIEGNIGLEARRFEVRYYKGPLTLRIEATPGDPILPGIPGTTYSGKAVVAADGGERFTWKVGEIEIKFEGRG